MSEGFAEFDDYTPAPLGEPAADEPADEPADQREGAGIAGPDVAGDPPVTENPRVDSATALLGGLEDLPTSEHADVFDEVHRRLQGALSDLDGA